MKIEPYDGLTLSDNQLKVLKAMVALAEESEEGSCYPFKTIAADAVLELRLVRIACRALRRKDLAEYHRGLMAWDDGQVAGSGYCASRKGIEVIARMEELEEAKKTTL